MDKTVQDLKDKVGNQALSNARRIGEQESRLTKLDEFVHKPTNTLEIIKKETDRIDARLTKKIKEVIEDIDKEKNDRLADMRQYEEWIAQHEKYYNLNVEAIQNITTTHVNSQKRLEIYERIMSEFHLNIEALKTHSLSTDLHLESTLPLQIASISFQVGMGSITKKQFPKFRKNFKARLRDLEKNFQDCSNPFIENYESSFRKNFYELPPEYINPAALNSQGSTKKLGRESKQSQGSSQSPRK